jgi:chemotaxis protein MotB
MKHGLNRSSAMLLLLMAPALLSACVSQSKYDELMAQNQQLQTENQQLHTQNQQLQQHVATAQAHVHRLQEAVKYTINSDLLFPSGGWEISAAGKEIIAKMAKKLAPEQQDKIIVNGYTDDHPIGPGLMQQGITSNQMLSQKRAETVMQYMISQGVNAELVAAQGFGEADPVAPNTTREGRAQNRRVEVTLAGAGS